jgi:hypothetical protein
VRVALRLETVGEVEEVGLADGVQHFGRRALDDLVFQRGDAQRSLPPVGLGDVASRLNPRPARCPVNASLPPSRAAVHDSGPVGAVIPSPCDSFIHYSSPV